MKLTLSLALLMGAASASNAGLKEKLATRKLLSIEGPVICHLYQMDGSRILDDFSEEISGNYTEVESYVCETSASEENDSIGRVYDIELPSSFIEDKKEIIQGGRAMLMATNAVKTRSYDSSLMLLPYRRARFFPFKRSGVPFDVWLENIIQERKHSS